MLFCSCDLDFDLDLMTLIYEPDLDILKMCLHIKDKYQNMQNLEPKENTQTHVFVAVTLTLMQ